MSPSEELSRAIEYLEGVVWVLKATTHLPESVRYLPHVEEALKQCRHVHAQDDWQDAMSRPEMDEPNTY